MLSENMAWHWPYLLCLHPSFSSDCEWILAGHGGVGWVGRGVDKGEMTEGGFTEIMEGWGYADKGSVFLCFNYKWFIMSDDGGLGMVVTGDGGHYYHQWGGLLTPV